MSETEQEKLQREMARHVRYLAYRAGFPNPITLTCGALVAGAIGIIFLLGLAMQLARMAGV